jgi:TolB-like protein/Flp pilus assembly protein TadD
MSLYNELKRRNVFRVGAAYIFAAWLIIQVAETIFPLYGFGDTPARITVTVLAIGFPLFLLFSWVFEITPEGLKKEKDIYRSESITHKTGKQLDRIIIVLLALALGYFAFDKFVLDPARDAEELATATQEAHQEGRSEAIVESFGDRSIAVLPFVNMSSDPEQEYFSDGISEELLNLLAKIPELRVISRTSAFAFKGEKVDIPEVARKLNVAHVLEGSVRKSGNQVRITTQLIEARSDTHLWSETFDRTLDDIFATQDEIAIAVVDALKLTLLGDVPKTEKTDPEAYALYLQAMYLGTQGTAEALEQSSAMLRQVLAIAPNYARAWRGLARNYHNQFAIGLLPRDEAFSLAHEATIQALAIDPHLAMAHAGLGWIAIYYDRDLAAAARHYGHALSLEPTNLSVLSNSYALLLKLGRANEAIAILEDVVTSDPLNVIGHEDLGYLYYCAGRPDEAIASLRTVLQLAPDRRSTHWKLGKTLLLKGENEAALKAFQLEPVEPVRLVGLVMAYHALGQTAESDAVLTELMEKHEREYAGNIAMVLAYRGEVDRAFTWLDKASQYHAYGLSAVHYAPELANLHDDPRWLPFLESIGMSPEQLGAIEFNVTLPE